MRLLLRSLSCANTRLRIKGGPDVSQRPATSRRDSQGFAGWFRVRDQVDWRFFRAKGLNPRLDFCSVCSGRLGKSGRNTTVYRTLGP
jgi:hypothetical protein